MKYRQLLRGRRGCLAGGLLVCALIAAGSVGWSGRAKAPGGEENLVLTERQKQILRDRNLPEEYEKLTAVQKETIREIEELLCWLEQKYNRSFEFAAYRPASFQEPDTAVLLFREAGADTEYRTAVLRRTWEGGKRILTDDFPAAAAEPLYEHLLQKHVREFMNASCKVYGCVTDTSLVFPPEKEEDLTGSIAADACIWLPGREVTPERADELASHLRQWLGERKISGRCQVMLLTEEAWERLTRKNFAGYFGSKACIYRKILRLP